MTRDDLRAGAAAGAVGVLLVVAASRWVTPIDSVRVGLGFLAFAVVPGVAIARIIGGRLRLLERAAVGTTLGLLASTVVYAITAAAHARWAFIAFPIGAGAYLVVKRRDLRGTLATTPAERRGVWMLLAIFVLALVPIPLLPFYGHNLDRRPDGTMSVVQLPDPTLHISITNELRHSVPPDAPFLSGERLAYHYAGDLTAAMFVDWTGVDTPDIVLRFVPALSLALLVVTAAALGQRWTKSVAGGVLFSALVVLCEDLSWVPGLLHGGALQSWSAWYFRVPTTFSLYYVNPLTWALSVLFVAMLCVDRAVRTGGRRWWVVATAAAALLWEYKLFTGALFALALVVAGAVDWMRRRRLGMLLAGLVSGSIGTAVAALVSMGTHAPDQTDFHVRWFDDVSSAMGLTGVLRGDALTSLERLTVHHEASLSGLGLLFAVALPVYAVGAYGPRLLAVATLRRRRRERVEWGTTPQLRMVAGITVIAGAVLAPTLFFAVGEIYNNAIWFAVTAKDVVWLFVVELVVLVALRQRRKATLLAAAIVLVCVPSTIESVHYERGHVPVQLLAASDVDAVVAAGRACHPGDVAITPQPLLAALLSLSQCRTFGLDVTGPSFTSYADLARRTSDVASFWADWDRGACPLSVIERYDVRVVLAAGNPDSRAVSECRASGFQPLATAPGYTVLRRGGDA